MPSNICNSNGILDLGAYDITVTNTSTLSSSDTMKIIANYWKYYY